MRRFPMPGIVLSDRWTTAFGYRYSPLDDQACTNSRETAAAGFVTPALNRALGAAPEVLLVQRSTR